ncbi:hypothetical protein SAMN05444143_1382 [Flavobacterium succinicans]|uniref:Uncharacterized protein n=1 Tax=Flavobacterium succinicans TaxID=29536 RepID=A0A1I5AEP1_9FLAO|nr:hypothetical protein [Flavobacterium succinicans]SFN60951.1 hypothetical protein SAMN05444143_1382 [Flavobacterium succinicans]
MKLDLYTKSILTVIAICLTINVLKDFDIMPKAYANEPLKNELNLLPNKNYGLIPVNADGTIDVNIKSSSEMKVDISTISTWDKMRVVIKENEDK